MKFSLSSVADQVQHMPEAEKLAIDLAAVFGWATALFGMLTGVVAFIAGVLSMAWCAIRLYETKTAQEWLRRRRDKAKRNGRA